MNNYGYDVSRAELLRLLSEQLCQPESRIEDSAAWRSHSGETDSLSVAELAMQVEMELDGTK